MSNKLTAKQLLHRLISKNNGAHAYIDYSKEFIDKLSDQDATYLLEFIEKTYLCRRDKPGDLLPTRTPEQIKEATLINHSARRDVLNAPSVASIDESKEK